MLRDFNFYFCSVWAVEKRPCCFILIHRQLLILQLVICVCFTVNCSLCDIVFQCPEGVRPCKRLVACHIFPYSFSGRLHGRLSYCFLILFVSFRGRLCKRLVACYRVLYGFTGRLHSRLPYRFAAQCISLHR